MAWVKGRNPPSGTFRIAFHLVRADILSVCLSIDQGRFGFLGTSLAGGGGDVGAVGLLIADSPVTGRMSPDRAPDPLTLIVKR